MAYIGKNPKFDGVIYEDQVAASVTAPKSGSHKIIDRNGTLFVVDSSGVESAVGSGSAGEINYIDEWDAEIAIANWATYKDAPQATPEDGTGTSTETVTFTRQTGTILRDTQSFKVTHSAANEIGEGAATAFTIKTQDTNKKLKIQFDYKTNEDAAYVAGDLTVYVYDVTNSTLITPVDTAIPVGQNIFQTSFNSTDSLSYRLIFHIATVNASAWDAYLDNIIVGPGMTSQGAAIGPWTAFTPALAVGDATFTDTGSYYRRVGDSMEVAFDVAYTGTGSVGSTQEFDIPEGLTAEKFHTTGNSQFSQGYGHWYDSSSGNNYSLAPKLYSTTSIGLNLDTASTDRDLLDNEVANGDRVQLFMTIPIFEWAGKGVVPMLAQDNLSEWQDLTPTGIYTTNTTYLGKYRRLGDTMEGEVLVSFAGQPNTATFYLDVPLGLTLDTAKIVANTNYQPQFGLITAMNSGVSETVGALTWNTVSRLYAVGDKGSGISSALWDLSTGAHPFTAGSGDQLRLSFKIPILEWAGSQNSLVGFSNATSTQSGLITKEVSETIDASTDAAYSAGTLLCYRAGNIVTITTSVGLTHASGATAVSAAGLIPSNYRPGGTITTVYDTDSSSIDLVYITSTGALGVSYKDYAGAGFAKTTSGLFTISYVMT